MVPISVQKELLDAQVDVQDLISEYGHDIKLFIRKESDVTRDKYKSIASGSGETTYPPKYDFKAYPVEHSPSRSQIEKAGVREDCQCIVWLADKDITDRGITFDSIENEKATVSLDGNEYRISSKGRVGNIGDGYYYLTLGLYKMP